MSKLLSDKKKLKLIVSILSVSFCCDSAMWINASIESIALAFPQVEYSTVLLISTIPYLTCVVAALLFGFVAGRKIGYRPLIIIGLFMTVLSGVGDFLVSDIMVVLVLRGIYGFGLGLLLGLNAYIMTVFDGATANKVIGLHVGFINIGSVIMQIACGALTDIAWNYAYLGYFVLIIPLILVIANFKEPAHVAEAAGTAAPQASKEHQGIHLPARVWLYIILIFVAVLLYYPLLALMSTYLANYGISSATIAGIVLAMYTAGSAVGGFAHPWLCRVMGRFVLPARFFIMAIGQLLVLLFPGNLAMITVGTFIGGFGFYGLLCLLPEWSSASCDDSSVQMACSLINIGSYVPVFVATYWMIFCEQVTGDMIVGSFAIAVIATAALGLLFMFVNVQPKVIAQQIAEQKEKTLKGDVQ